jgi:hypothetical protein
MGINIGASGETGIWAGPSQVIQDGLSFYVDPGNVSCYNYGNSSTAVTDMGQGVSMTLSGASWGDNDGGVSWSFDGINDSIVSDSTVTYTNYLTGNSTTAGTITVCIWFRTGKNYIGATGGSANLINLDGYVYSLFFQNGYLYLYASGDAGTTTLYNPATGGYHSTYTYTDLEGDNWYFYIGQINNKTSTDGDTPAGYVKSYVARGDAGGSAELLDEFASNTLNADFEFDDADFNIELGYGSDNGWYFEGEIGPVMLYNRCLTEAERVHNYNVFRHRYYDTAIG